MTGFLLDTNVVSELRRRNPNPRVTAFIAAQTLQQLYVSAVTFAEIRYGIELLDDISKRRELDVWLTHHLRPLFRGRVLPVSEDVMLTWRLLLEAGRKSRHTFSQPDLIIAATAAHHGMTIVSRDTHDYERARVPVLNPWLQPTLSQP